MAQASGPAGLLAFAEQVYPMLERYSYYQLLRVATNADTGAIRTSYYKIASQLHPDRYQRLVDPDTRDRLETIYARITEAYRVLTNGEKRAAYDAGLARGKMRETGERPLRRNPEDALSHPEAKKFFRLGMVSFGNKDWKGAVMNFNFARSFEPDAPLIAEKLAEAQAAAKTPEVTVPPVKETTPDRPGEKEVTPRPTPSVRKGTLLGRYVIDEVLGHGAMATVFRARDGQLGRTVAIKVMNMAIAARSDAGERFRREAQAVATLRHPGIVEVHDFAAATEHEPAYIVAELIEGPTLRGFIDGRRGRLLPEVAVLIAAQIADALAVAHEQGIVHRDVKPDNVMLEKRGKAARVVLTDFGVAHITGLETMTASGALVGSPAYMSPEQARGHDIGPAADIWGVGVLLYQMVTGTLPFPGKEAFAVIAAVARGTFKRASHVAAVVSPELDQVIARCLHPTPAERYQGARALAEDLRALSREGALGDELTALRQFLDDPDAFEAALRPRIADAAVARARQHVRRGELARALNQVGRATAYVSDHRGADAVLRSISARRRWIKGASVAGITALVGALGYFGWAIITRPRPAPTVLTMPVAPATAPVTPPLVTAPAAVQPPVEAQPPPAPPVKKRSKHAASPVRREPPAPAVVAAPTPEVAAPPRPEPPPPPPPEPKPQPGLVKLLASKGFCHPSLDDRPVADGTVVEYPDVEPGKHRVFCARDKDSPKLLAGEILVKSGVKVERTIKWTDDKPHF